MSFDHQHRRDGRGTSGPTEAPQPGKRTLSEELGEPDVPAIAQHGVAGSGGSLPHLDRVQRAFGKHDVSGVTAHVGGAAAGATAALDTRAYAVGNDVAFAGEPDLFTVAHEAAHVVQQRDGVQLAGGLDARDDAYELHADAVAGAVVRGESAEALLDRGPQGGGSGRPVVQRDRNRDRVERGQVWDPTIAGPLSPEDAATVETDVEAIRANVALGLTGDKIRRLRAALGLRATARMAHAIDRDVVRGIRRVQGGSGSGVLDEDTVFQLDLGASWRGAVGRGRYLRSAPWTGLDRVRFDALRAQVLGAVRVSDADLAFVGGRTIVSERFIQQVVNWQFFHRAREEAVVWGFLAAADLAEMGVDIEVVPTPASPDATPAPAPTGPAADEEAADTAAELDEVDEAEPSGGPLAQDSEEGRALEKIAERMRAYLRERHARRRDRAAQAALDAERTPQIDADHARAMQLGVNNDRIFAAAQARPSMKARWTEEAIREAFGATLPPLPARGRRGTSGPATGTPEPEGSAPALERTSEADAAAHLQAAGVVVDRDASGAMQRTELVRGASGWEGRALGGRAGTVAPVQEVRAAAASTRAQLVRLKEQRLDRWQARLEAALAAPATLAETLAQLYDDLRADAFAVPRTLRRPLQLALPRDLSETQWSTPERARATARRWRNALRGAAALVQRSIALHERYQGESIRRNPNAVRCDLSRTGVRVTNNGGRQLGPDEMHLDIAFAEAMLRFLEMLRGLGATEMRTAGFLRDPISPDDTHPWGRACDITGFRFGAIEIMLRNGRRDPAGYAAGTTRFSDWFNHEQRVDGQTYAQILQAITARMATYFNGITGPGHDAAHDNHWHVQLTGRDSGSPIHAIQDVADEGTTPE